MNKNVSQTKDFINELLPLIDTDKREVVLFPPFTSLTNGPTDKRLHVGAESAQWLADHGVVSVGFGDGVTIDKWCNASS